MGFAIGTSVLMQRNPRLLFWILVSFICGFVPLALWVTAGEIRAFRDGHEYSAATACRNGPNCYQTEPATVVRTTEYPDQYSRSVDAVVTVQTGGGEIDIRLNDRDAWMDAHVGAGADVEVQLWRGRVTELVKGGQTFRSVDYPSFDWTNVWIALFAWLVTAGLAYMAYMTRQVINFRPGGMGVP